MTTQTTTSFTNHWSKSLGYLSPVEYIGTMRLCRTMSKNSLGRILPMTTWCCSVYKRGKVFFLMASGERRKDGNSTLYENGVVLAVSCTIEGLKKFVNAANAANDFDGWHCFDDAFTPKKPSIYD